MFLEIKQKKLNFKYVIKGLCLYKFLLTFKKNKLVIKFIQLKTISFILTTLV